MTLIKILFEGFFWKPIFYFLYPMWFLTKILIDLLQFKSTRGWFDEKYTRNLTESFFLTFPDLDDTNIEKAAEYLIEIDIVDATSNDHVDDVNIVKSFLE